ncbi:hypothetical protein BBAD15_g7989 [Beauveria bassiana D1-5]|uniref:Uncharacterized protein n=1 Tax=Beauveria bassiana D1-5 TaxID=1245745 RepID=A0A0A2VFT0_BEABA|nr:hypothetical protein BBAD15_g7989 [Beauveria bassiana D1-5]
MLLCSTSPVARGDYRVTASARQQQYLKCAERAEVFLKEPRFYLAEPFSQRVGPARPRTRARVARDGTRKSPDGIWSHMERGKEKRNGKGPADIEYCTSRLGHFVKRGAVPSGGTVPGGSPVNG